jgi:SprT protein
MQYESKQKQLAVQLSEWIPANASERVAEFIIQHKVHLHIKRARTTKLGDYRPPHKGKGHSITVNNNLNPFACLITLTHEMAHLLAWVQYQNRVAPHGPEWKAIYAKELMFWLENDIFPPELTGPIIQHIHRPGASTCADPELFSALRSINQHSPNHTSTLSLLRELPCGTIFKLKSGRVFKSIEKRRTRFLCLEIPGNKRYLINGIAEVQPIDSAKTDSSPG